MPIYTYECQSCSGTLEKRQSFTEDPLTIHDTCGGSLRRVIHPAGIVFKGSGFYNTDYKNGSAAKTAADAEAKPAGDTAPAEKAAPATSTETATAPAASAAPAAPAKSDASSSTASTTTS